MPASFDAAAAGATPPPVPQSALIDLDEFNRMVAQAQRLEAVARLSSGVAHDFNNLLTVIIGLCEIWLARTPENAEIRADLRDMRQSAERAAELTRHLATFARARSQEPRAVDVVARLREMDRLLRRLLGEGTRLRLSVDPATLPVVVDSGELDQLLVHLAARAGEVTPAGGEIFLACTNRVLKGRSLPSGNCVEIRLEDAGPAPTAEDLDGVFETAPREPGGAAGLGPAWCREFARRHGGDLVAEAGPEGGTVFRLLLPAATRADHPALARDTSVLTTRGTETVLVLEDDAGVRRIAVSALKQNGYRVLEAATSEAALAAGAASARDGIQLLVTDLVLPGLSGPSVFARLRALHPDLRVLYVSGYGEDAPQLLGITPVDGPVLAKPFSPPRLVRRARAQLDGRPPVLESPA